MTGFVTITDDGRFALDGARWYCNSVVYFGHTPGAMLDWFAPNVWEGNRALLDRDFGLMAQAGLNHAALFLRNEAFFDAGKIISRGMDCMDAVVEAARKAGLRISIFCGPFIDTPDEFYRITGRPWEHDNRWLPSFNPALHAAYVDQMRPFAERYKHEPTVLAYTDRIDRYFKGFDNVSIPFNLKEEWGEWLRQRYGTFGNLLDAVGGTLEGHPTDFHEVLLPQESRFGGSLQNPMAYDYILMQKSDIGDAQARFDAAINAVAPHQFVWTPFEGNTNTWAMLDGFSPETRKLQAIWMEYYFFEVTRPSFVQPFEEWAHTREVIHRRLAHELPVVYNAAYMMTRYLKQTVQRPVVMCHGAFHDSAAYGIENETQHAAIIDRVNAACLNADGDGWHYWSWTDDYQSKSSHMAAQQADPTAFYWYGESTGLLTEEGYPRPALTVATRYSRELARRAAANPPVKRGEVLLLNSAPRMYNLFRRMAYPTAAAMAGALSRLGVECDYLWTAQNDLHIDQATLDAYKLIVIADNMYERDFRDMPDKLLAYVEAGGTLYFALDRFDRFKDEHGVPVDSPALTRLSGVDPTRAPDWPGAGVPCANWPYPTDAALEANMDVMSFPRLAWGVCPGFRHLTPQPFAVQLLGFRSTDDDTFTVIPGLADDAETIAVGKFPAGTRPFFYRHTLGKGTVYVNAWTSNLFRDSESRNDYGGWDYDWLLDLPLATAGVTDIDLTRGAALWLRHTWGYFWRTM
jgi:hypothetical protein